MDWWIDGLVDGWMGGISKLALPGTIGLEGAWLSRGCAYCGRRSGWPWRMKTEDGRWIEDSCDRLRAGHKANDFGMMPPRTGLEIILKAVFLQRFRAAGAGIGNLMASGTNTCAFRSGGGLGRGGSFDYQGKSQKCSPQATWTALERPWLQAPSRWRICFPETAWAASSAIIR